MQDDYGKDGNYDNGTDEKEAYITGYDGINFDIYRGDEEEPIRVEEVSLSHLKFYYPQKDYYRVRFSDCEFTHLIPKDDISYWKSNS